MAIRIRIASCNCPPHYGLECFEPITSFPGNVFTPSPQPHNNPRLLPDMSILAVEVPTPKQANTNCSLPPGYA